jgi:large subunit ribosomal protein L15
VKLHDLKPAVGSKRKRIRVGRGIAAGRGKTAGYGTKGQTARSGGSIPAWFEGGQTPIHIRIPKLRGFRNVLRVESAVVNVGRIQNWIDAGRLKGESPLTINVDILEAAGLMKSRGKPLKVLGGGNLTAKLFVLADSFTESALTKIKAAGGSTQVLQLATAESAAPVGVAPKGAKSTSRTAPKVEASETSPEA